MTIPTRYKLARIATFGGFSALGGMAYIWSTGVTEFREQLGLSGSAGDLRFGMIALSSGIAAALGSFFVGFFADRYGPRRVVAVGAVVYPLLIIALGQVHGWIMAVPVVASLGLFRGAQDTALNTHGIQVERYYHRSIMSSFHFCYSFGGFLLGMAGSWLANRYTDSATAQFTLLGGAMLALGVGSVFWMLRQDELLEMGEPELELDASGAPIVTVKAVVVLLMIGFGLLLLGSMVGENVVGDWGQEYISRVTHSTAAVAGVAVSVFIGAEAFGRIFGDRLAQTFGRATVVFGSGILAVGGLTIMMAIGTPIASLIGFGTLGLGLSSIAPLMLSSAGRADPANAGRNIGIVNAIGYSGNLVSPAAITFVVTVFGLSHLLIFPLIMLLPLALFGPILMKKSEQSHFDDETRPSFGPSDTISTVRETI